MTLSRPLCPRQCAALMTDNSSSRRSLKVTSGSVDGEDNDVLPNSPLWGIDGGYCSDDAGAYQNSLQNVCNTSTRATLPSNAATQSSAIDFGKRAVARI